MENEKRNKRRRRQRGRRELNSKKKEKQHRKGGQRIEKKDRGAPFGELQEIDDPHKVLP